MSFEFKRAGITHRYEITDSALEYQAGATTRVRLDFKDLESIQPGRTGAPMLHARGHQGLAVWLEPNKMEEFFSDLFRAWGRLNRGAAGKAAFDYASDSRAAGWLWLVVGLLFPGLLSVLLLADAYNTRKCNRLLEAGTVTTAQVTKVKKNRRGNMVWDLSFRTNDGLEMLGKRTAFVYDEKGNPNSPVSVVYSQEDPNCWDLSLRPGENALNHAQRNFSLMVTMSFGWAFAVVTAIVVTAGVARLRRKHPFKDAVQRAAKVLGV